jgi:hypothetical protein
VYFYYQIEKSQEVWHEALAEKRDEIVATKKPRYTTVLDLDMLIEKSHTRENIDKVKYRGPFYVDWDGSNSDLDTVIGKVRQFINQLEENEVDLDSISWYASGSRSEETRQLTEKSEPAEPLQRRLPSRLAQDHGR